MTTESTPKQQDSTKKKQNRCKKRFLLSTKLIDARKLHAEIEQLEMELFMELMETKNESPD